MKPDYNSNFTSALYTRDNERSKRRRRRKNTYTKARKRLSQAGYQYYGYYVCDTVYQYQHETRQREHVERVTVPYTAKDGNTYYFEEYKLVPYTYQVSKLISETPIKPYAKSWYCSRSRSQAKKYTNSKVRSIKDLPTNPSSYRKVFDYAWYIS